MYGWIAAGVLAVLLAGSGMLLRQAYKDLGEVEARYAVQRAETKMAVAQIADLRVQHARQIEASKAAQQAWSKERVALTASNQRLRARTDSLEAALAREPERAGRAGSYLFYRGLREICRSSGADAAACKAGLPRSSKTRRRSPASTGVGAAGSVGGKEREGKRPDLPSGAGLGEPSGVQQGNRVLDAQRE